MIAVSALVVMFALAVIYYPSPDGPLAGREIAPWSDLSRQVALGVTDRPDAAGRPRGKGT